MSEAIRGPVWEGVNWSIDADPHAWLTVAKVEEPEPFVYAGLLAGLLLARAVPALKRARRRNAATA